MNYKVALRQSEEGNSVSCPALPGCWSQRKDGARGAGEYSPCDSGKHLCGTFGGPMKGKRMRILNLGVVVSMLVLLIACGENSPDAVLHATATCHNNGDIDCYVSHYTPSHAISNFGGVEQFKMKLREQLGKAKISYSITESKVTGDRATIRATKIETYGKGDDNKIPVVIALIKENGRWLIEGSGFERAL